MTPGRDPVALIGAGGLGRETVEVIRAVATAGGQLEAVAFLDDDEALRGRTIQGVPVVGGTAEAPSLAGIRFLVCLGSALDNRARQLMVEQLALDSVRYASLVHPDAVVGSTVTIGYGTIVLAGSVLTADVRLGDHVVVMPGCVLTHDNVVDDFATMASGARLGGRVHVGRGAYIGAGALVRERLMIGAGAVIGMGAVVLEDVPAHQLWTGMPARFKRTLGDP